MMQSGSSLDNLRDIAEPVSVSWWPLAPGWWVLIAISFVALAIYGYRTWQLWKANAYRRSALAELQTASTDADISAILKRTALCAYPRINVASLAGEDWCRWLAKTSGTQLLSSVSERLLAGFFGDDSTRTNELTDFATRWINNHRTETEDRKGSKDRGWQW